MPGSINDELPDETDIVSSMADVLLGTIAHNRIRRLAKGILVSTFEFLLALLTLFFFDFVGSAESHNDQATQETMVSCSGYTSVEEAQQHCAENPSRGKLTVICTTVQGSQQECRVEGTLMLSPVAFVLGFVVGVYAIALAWWSYRRAKRAADHNLNTATTASAVVYRTAPDIEADYAQTNDWPFVDGILEVPLTVKYLGYRLPVLLWGFNVLCIVAVIAAWTASHDSDDRPSMIFSSVLAVVQMYRICSNVSELLVLTSDKGLCVVDAQDGRSNVDEEEALFSAETDVGKELENKCCHPQSSNNGSSHLSTQKEEELNDETENIDTEIPTSPA